MKFIVMFFFFFFRKGNVAVRVKRYITFFCSPSLDFFNDERETRQKKYTTTLDDDDRIHE